MSKRFWLAICLIACGTLTPHGTLYAEEASQARQISYAELTMLSDAIVSRGTLSDNVFQFRQRSDEIRQMAQRLPGSKLQFTVAVSRVSEHEVTLSVPNAGKTRIVFRHSELPEYGNLRTVFYSGPLTTQFAQILSKPISMRIGTEIPLATAQKLRKGDLLLLNGTLENVHLLLDVFEPHAVAVISAVTVTQVQPENSRKYFY